VTHTALARKYRPRTFSDVSTQEHVSETLRRAVAGDRVGHAYLFCGPRGIGKTTMARVLAMALNCPDRSAEGEPCGACDSCERIWSGHTSLDVVEIDAASNRGVDDARELRERAMYAPSEEGRHKIYIVDEAHMLTREAWNALLKILEEPPPRVIFVFATTEPQKIQQTAAPILSRCQRFDFRRIGAGDITARLTQVLAGEGTEAPEEALRMVARKADGGLRDALSLLDQVLALTGGEVSQESVRSVLGLVEEERYLELFDLLASRRHGDVFEFVERLVDEGYDLSEFYLGLNEALRTLLRLRLQGGAPSHLSDHIVAEYRSRAQAFAPGDLLRMLTLASDLGAGGNLRRAAQHKILLELLLLRLSHLDRTVELEDLIRGLGGASRGDAAVLSTGPSTPQSPPVPPEPPRKGKASAQPPKAEQGASAGAESATAPESATSPPGDAATAPGTAAGPHAAWERLLSGKEKLPAGVALVLRTSSLVGVENGVARIQVPEGPGLDRLREPDTRAALGAVFTDAMGHPVTVEATSMTGPEEAEGQRITPDTVRQGRVQALVEEDPKLGHAVETLDLELME
jgi:DNA polymerase-3 subunit gamma/tau